MKPQWEYQVIEKFGASGRNIEDNLNDLGKDGWEVAGVGMHGASQFVYLKRQRRDPQ
jgi:hypothetical protein